MTAASLCRDLLLLLVVSVTCSPAAGDERSTARRFEDARRDEPSLVGFLRLMPKGGDRRVRPQYVKLQARGWVPTPDDVRTLAASDKATVQARLERALLEFER